MFVTTVGLKAEMKDEDWIIDSGASRHMTFQRTIIKSLKHLNQLAWVMDTLLKHWELEK